MHWDREPLPSPLDNPRTLTRARLQAEVQALARETGGNWRLGFSDYGGWHGVTFREPVTWQQYWSLWRGDQMIASGMPTRYAFWFVRGIRFGETNSGVILNYGEMDDGC